MAPSAKKIEAALIDGTCQVFRDEPDATTVNKVRKHVEDDLGLEDGYFAGSEWKQRSKTLIKETVEKLLDGWTPDLKEEPQVKNGVKRQSAEPSAEPESPKAKRQKRESKPKAKRPLKSESDVGSDAEEKKPKKKTKSVAKAAKAETDEEEIHVKSSPSPGPKRKRKLKAKEESDEDAKVKSPIKDEDKGAALKRQGDVSDEEKPSAKDEDPDDEAKPAVKDEETKAVVEEEEYSDVLDEDPHPKRKKRSKDAAAKPPKAAKSSAKKSAPAAPEDPHEAEIKKLQNQLSKCGVRKFWHNELKQHGDDTRAKIRHLKKMLAEVGVEGRFSEAKAREIREARELQADAEAAQEMNALWGMGGRRASRSKGKAEEVKVEDVAGSDEGEGPGDEDDEEDTTFAARRRRAQADLAFLGDDSDSD